MPSAHARALLLAAAALLALGSMPGCALSFMPTPNVVASGALDPFEDVPEARRVPEVEILYATDRNPQDADAPSMAYGYDRVQSLAYGRCVVGIGDGLDWDELVEVSRSGSRLRPHGLSVESVTELGRFPRTPMPRIVGPRGPELTEDAVAEQAIADARFCDLLREELAHDDSGRVLVYVHGYNNTFRDATVVAAQFWHFLGRRGAVVAYTWPAGAGGLRGYTHDRESGEFTVLHLKQLLRAIGSCDAVRRVDILAHSRGTDVATSALRELVLEIQAADLIPREELKLGHVVLAAPDLDLEVVSQRLTGEGVHLVPESFTVYFSVSDNAIGLANWLFAGAMRLGGLVPDRLKTEQVQNLRTMPASVNLVQVDVDQGFFGHSYFYESPAASSDLLMLLSRGCMPGAGRPLARDEMDCVWLCTDGYPPVVAPAGAAAPAASAP